ncbi:hypothetical protein PF005_g11599 [Phytophthora fragariae]|uniref:Uncharacterized protein n=2 Tax=Phytophthora TaxID=4783 RepID=A0A6A4DP15_9STRA|nr:hypothetical protein PF009_g9652 [Phytophthora fragariae]KAE9024950.1 hypothetical protein PR002_g11315 [Phytophthora rubi]KAE9030593.1 hypothetical protein PR001_g11209 [Phytophthora rubi]KAE9111132.1 hypothetical protein PF007_g11601 [Phytophthora fragariae]KAE9144253.1 hypothetical protein PF006_g10787 [Phytophthora fragariae]
MTRVRSFKVPSDVAIAALLAFNTNVVAKGTGCCNTRSRHDGRTMPRCCRHGRMDVHAPCISKAGAVRGVRELHRMGQRTEPSPARARAVGAAGANRKRHEIFFGCRARFCLCAARFNVEHSRRQGKPRQVQVVVS